LRALAEELPLKQKIVVCLESLRLREDDGIEVLPLSDFLKELAAKTIKAGIKQNMISDYEKGRRRLTKKMASRFADILKVKSSRLQ
jgi:hypothetical protein